MCRPFKRSPARARKHPVPFTGNPIDIQNSAPQSNVKFSKLRFGTLGSTYPGGNQRMIMMTVIIMMKIISINNDSHIIVNNINNDNENNNNDNIMIIIIYMGKHTIFNEHPVAQR